MSEYNMGKRLVSDTEAAPILGLSVQTLRNWRCINVGPRYVRIGDRTIRYDVGDLERYIAERRVIPRDGTG